MNRCNRSNGNSAAGGDLIAAGYGGGNAQLKSWGAQNDRNPDAGSLPAPLPKETSMEIKAVMQAGIDNAVKNGGLAKIEQDMVKTEQVFLHWIEDTSMTPNKLAVKAGITLKEARDMLATGEFQRKYMEVQQGFTEIAEPYLKARAKEVMQSVMGRLETIVEVGSDKDAIAAGRLIADLATTKEMVHGTTINVDNRVLQVAADGMRDMAAVQRALAAQLDSNIVEATEVRTAKRG